MKITLQLAITPFLIIEAVRAFRTTEKSASSNEIAYNNLLNTAKTAAEKPKKHHTEKAKGSKAVKASKWGKLPSNILKKIKGKKAVKMTVEPMSIEDSFSPSIKQANTINNLLNPKATMTSNASLLAELIERSAGNNSLTKPENYTQEFEEEEETAALDQDPAILFNTEAFGKSSKTEKKKALKKAPTPEPVSTIHLKDKSTDKPHPKKHLSKSENTTKLEVAEKSDQKENLSLINNNLEKMEVTMQSFIKEIKALKETISDSNESSIISTEKSPHKAYKLSGNKKHADPKKKKKGVSKSSETDL
ncbi:hypothetical protein NEIRO03_2153 [Nematocida sp. AWRm78]|nr:hypothetical protein NEIRO02_2118 [Nematocida sp. AWRm79]KAI5185922.1 hypothetical protein NEIRO03_2153 [Nematocida sp. AWRm78]